MNDPTNLIQASDENASSGNDKNHAVSTEGIIVDSVTLSKEVKT
jgi:hypothetical protein